MFRSVIIIEIFIYPFGSDGIISIAKFIR